MSISVSSRPIDADQAIDHTFRKLAEAALNGGLTEEIRCLEVAARSWARTGVPLDAVHAELRESMKTAFRQCFSCRTVGAGWGECLIEALVAATTVLSAAYAAQSNSRQDTAAVRSLAAALLGGAAKATSFARECGIDIAESYAVIAMAFSADEVVDAAGAELAAHRLRAELARWCGGVPLARLSAVGGTILVPSPHFDDDLDGLIVNLSAAAGRSLTATTVPAAPAGIPAAAHQAHELLDVATALGRTGGLYRFGDLALEFQLTRSGPGSEHLSTLLDPLEEFPELLETLRLYFADGASRRRMAHKLNVHMNTVDNRLKRIAGLTGLDPLTSRGQWYLYCALITRSARMHSGVAADSSPPTPATSSRPPDLRIRKRDNR